LVGGSGIAWGTTSIGHRRKACLPHHPKKKETCRANVAYQLMGFHGVVPFSRAPDPKSETQVYPKACVLQSEFSWMLLMCKKGWRVAYGRSKQEAR
jgi:hypothetical protein